MTAEQACAEYEFWAAEIRRLTTEIVATYCPRELMGMGDGGSHFQEARETAMPRRQPDDSTIPTLADIGELVKNCPECSRLVKLIRGRQHARQRLGVAKRRIRAIGKRVIASESPERCESGCEAPVVAHDSEGVPLCAECAASLAESAPTSTLEGE